MRARRCGHIVKISSMTGLVANPPNAYSSSSKSALEALTEALASEVRPLGEPPLRLLLGRDVLKAMRDKIAALTSSIDEWEAVTRDVNFPAS